MGYSIHVTLSKDGGLSESDIATATKWAEQTTSILSDDAEDLMFDDEDGELCASFKPSRDEDEMSDDMDHVISCAESLSTQLPSVNISVTDDFDSDLFSSIAS